MAGKGLTWEKVTSFFDGLGGVADSIGGITDTGADIAEDIARGRGAIQDQQLDAAERKQAMFLENVKVMRQDNVQLYWAGAFAAVLGIILLAKK